MPSPSALRTFDAAARLASFKEAARELHVTPTAVSHQIRALEVQIGVALFVRRTRAVELTEAGARLASATRGAFQQIEDALETIVEAENVLTVSTTPAFAALWLVPRLAAFERRFPQLRVRIDAATTPVDLARDRRIDLAIRYGVPGQVRLPSRLLVEERLGAYGAPAYLEQLAGFDAAALLETEWQREGLPGRSWAMWAEAAGLSGGGLARRVRRFGDEHHAVQAALVGQGLFLGSELLVADVVARGWLVRYRPEVSIPGLAYTAVWGAAGVPSRKVERFVDWLADELGGLPPRG
ncbi:LysR substrate-binding domain-containing protein [Vulgatibacter sp.]|uniref:LysR substrate-binding domain-containing protein n=1 Tax=Vulgatibacter sp. TaxID=1971226 RepID=UPI00356A1AA6